MSNIFIFFSHEKLHKISFPSIFAEEESKKLLGHKRSLSSESPRNLMHAEDTITYPSYIVAGSREMAIDVDNLKGDDEAGLNRVLFKFQFL